MQVVVATATKRVYIAGQIGVDTDHVVVGPDLASQTAKAFENLGVALEAAGASWEPERAGNTSSSGPAMSWAWMRRSWASSSPESSRRRTTGSYRPQPPSSACRPCTCRISWSRSRPSQRSELEEHSRTLACGMRLFLVSSWAGPVARDRQLPGASNERLGRGERASVPMLLDGRATSDRLGQSTSRSRSSAA